MTLAARIIFLMVVRIAGSFRVNQFPCELSNQGADLQVYIDSGVFVCTEPLSLFDRDDGRLTAYSKRAFSVLMGVRVLLLMRFQSHVIPAHMEFRRVNAGAPRAPQYVRFTLRGWPTCSADRPVSWSVTEVEQP